MICTLYKFIKINITVFCVDLGSETHGGKTLDI